MAKKIRVLHAPLHGSSATDAELRSALSRPGVHAVGFSEAYRHGDFLGGRRGWSAAIGGTRRDANGRLVERDVILLVKRRFRRLAWGVRFACPQAEPLKIAPERYITWAMHKMRRRKVLIIGFHPHAAVQQAWDSDRAEAYREGMLVLQRFVSMMRRRHGKRLEIIIMGDFNYRNVRDGREMTPRDLFESLGLDFFARGLDWVAWSDGLMEVGVEIIEPKDNGQDHPWLEVTFQVA